MAVSWCGFKGFEGSWDVLFADIFIRSRPTTFVGTDWGRKVGAQRHWGTVPRTLRILAVGIDAKHLLEEVPVAGVFSRSERPVVRRFFQMGFRGAQRLSVLLSRPGWLPVWVVIFPGTFLVLQVELKVGVDMVDMREFGWSIFLTCLT